MAASSATPVPYFSALFIKVLETTYKSHQLSASGLVKYVRLSVSGYTISEWDEKRERREENCRNRHWIHTDVHTRCIQGLPRTTHNTLIARSSTSKRSWSYWAASLAPYLYQIKANLINSSMF